MTKKLEEILNLPNVKEAFKQVDAKEKNKESKNTNGVSSKNLDPITAKNSRETFNEKNWNNAVQTGTFLQNDLSISGGTDNGKYFFACSSYRSQQLGQCL